jgi:hypothetical protein
LKIKQPCLRRGKVFTTGYDLATRTTLHWQDEFGRGHEFRNFTSPPGVVLEDPNDERYLVFTAGGIDIRDTLGTTLGLEVDESSFKASSCHDSGSSAD